jgi:hypothetical protein
VAYDAEHTIEIDTSKHVWESINIMSNDELLLTIVLADVLMGPDYPAHVMIYTNPDRNPFLSVDLPIKFRKD